MSGSEATPAAADGGLAVAPLLQPMKLNHLMLANRMVMGPMAVTAPDREGRVTDQTLAFFEARARGGVGMIIVGGAIGTQRGWDEAPFRPILRMDRDEFLPGLRRLGDAMHALGVPLIAEVSTAFGRMGVPTADRPLISASPLNVVIPESRFPRGLHVPGGRTTPMPQEASVAEIQAYERETVESSLRMQRAGWDGVELPAHMSYFLASFLAPRTNWRADAYGGSVLNRARMLANMVRAIRERAGPRFVIGLRLVSSDQVEGGQSSEGYAAIAREVEAAGLDYVALSQGCYETMNVGLSVRDGTIIEDGDAAAFRQAVSVPLLLPGLHDPVQAARAIAQGHGDLVMLARPLLADPEYPRKVVQGRVADIVRCERDNLCIRRLMFNMPVRCSVNPRMGLESKAPGSLGDPKRLLAAPLEYAVLALTGSKTLMGLAGKLLRARATPPGPGPQEAVPPKNRT